MENSKLDTNELFTIIGEQTVQIRLMGRRIAELNQELEAKQKAENNVKKEA